MTLQKDMTNPTLKSVIKIVSFRSFINVFQDGLTSGWKIYSTMSFSFPPQISAVTFLVLETWLIIVQSSSDCILQTKWK